MKWERPPRNQARKSAPSVPGISTTPSVSHLDNIFRLKVPSPHTAWISSTIGTRRALWHLFPLKVLSIVVTEPKFCVVGVIVEQTAFGSLTGCGCKNVISLWTAEPWGRNR